MNSDSATSNFLSKSLSPPAFNFKSDDFPKTTGSKWNNNTPSVFHFGDQKDSAHKKSDTAFNFVFGDSFKFSSKSEITQSEIPFLETNKDSKDTAAKIEADSVEKSNEVMNSHQQDEDKQQKKDALLEHEQEDNEEEETLNENFTIKILLKEFKELIHEFIKERVQNDKRIITLEEKVVALEKELKILKNEDNKNSSADIIIANDPTTSTLTTQTTPFVSLNSPPIFFGSTSTVNSNTVPANFPFGKTIFSNTLTQTPLANQLFNTCTQTSCIPTSAISVGTIPPSSLSAIETNNTANRALNTEFFTCNSKNGANFKWNTCNTNMCIDGQPNKRSCCLNTSNRFDTIFVDKSKLEMEQNLQQCQKNCEKTDERMTSDQRLRTIEELFQITMKNMFTEFKNILGSELSKKK